MSRIWSTVSFTHDLTRAPHRISKIKLSNDAFTYFYINCIEIKVIKKRTNKRQSKVKLLMNRAFPVAM